MAGKLLPISSACRIEGGYCSTPECLLTLAEDSITIPGVSPEEFILHQVGSCFLGVSPELTGQQEKNKVGRVNPSSRQPPTHISGPRIFPFLGFSPRHDKQAINYFFLLLSLQGDHR